MSKLVEKSIRQLEKSDKRRKFLDDLKYNSLKSRFFRRVDKFLGLDKVYEETDWLWED